MKKEKHPNGWKGKFMKKPVVITISAILILALCGCDYLFMRDNTNYQILETPSEAQSAAPPVTLTARFNTEDFQRVDGSTVTLPLMQLFAAKTTDASPLEIDNNLKHNKTYQAFYNLTNKDESGKYVKDIIFTTLQSEETINSSSVELEIKPAAQDGFVFLVNKENPVQSLTKKQIIDIYTGNITNWKQVGGDDAKILAYQRQKDSGSQDGMFDLVMGDNKINNSVTVITNSMEGLVDSIANYENSKYAIGYSYYYFTTVQYVKENTKLLSIGGIEPTITNFSNGSYPLVAKYYAIIRADEPKDSFARKFLNLVLSDDGQKVVMEAGYVKIN